MQLLNTVSLQVNTGMLTDHVHLHNWFSSEHTCNMQNKLSEDFHLSIIESLTLSCPGLAEHDKWRVGKVEPLQTQEDSPFIGQLDPGKQQLAIETGMYRAPGFPYSPPATDFLLIRNATGAISLRELTGCIVVGQEVPSMRAPIPHSRDVRY